MSSTMGWLGSEECDGENGADCVCIEPVEPTCPSGINRGDFNLATDGTNCDEDRNNSVSLGIDGELEISFDDDLTDCSVQIFEKGGINEETYSVYVCPADYDEEYLSDCVLLDSYTSSDAEISDQTFDISFDDQGGASEE